MSNNSEDGALSRDEAVAMLKRSVEEWNKYREAHPCWDKPTLSTFENPTDLQGIELSGANLGGSFLRKVNLKRANLIFANLCNADLALANISDAYLNFADLSIAYLVDANLNRSRLCSAILTGIKLVRTEVSNADFESAYLGWATLANTDLSTARNLEKVRNEYPSTIGIDTIIKSKGKIPEEFLRGCGVPDNWITYIPSLIASMQPFEFYSCFLSHSSQDAEFCDKLHARLEDAKVPVWYSRKQTKMKRLRGGRYTSEELHLAVRTNDRLLIVLSEHSIKSSWVETELAEAVKKQNETGKRTLFPISLMPYEDLEMWKCSDPDTGRNLSREVRKYNIPDFTEWQDEAKFNEAVDWLITDLKKDEPAATDDRS